MILKSTFIIDDHGDQYNQSLAGQVGCRTRQKLDQTVGRRRRIGRLRQFIVRQQRTFRLQIRSNHQGLAIQHCPHRSKKLRQLRLDGIPHDLEINPEIFVC